MSKEGNYYKCTKTFELCSFDDKENPTDYPIGLAVCEGSIWVCDTDDNDVIRLRLHGTPFNIRNTVKDGFFKRHFVSIPKGSVKNG